jgi:hypothetical protein
MCVLLVLSSLSSLHLFAEIESNLVITMNSLNARTLKVEERLVMSSHLVQFYYVHSRKSSQS